MTNPEIPMTCDGVRRALADFLERDVDEATRARMEAHALQLRRLRSAARRSSQRCASTRRICRELAPSRDLWAGIAERIETPVVALNPSGETPATRASSRRWRGAWMGLAAAGLVAVTATVTLSS